MIVLTFEGNLNKSQTSARRFLLILFKKFAYLIMSILSFYCRTHSHSRVINKFLRRKNKKRHHCIRLQEDALFVPKSAPLQKQLFSLLRTHTLAPDPNVLDLEWDKKLSEPPGRKELNVYKSHIAWVITLRWHICLPNCEAVFSVPLHTLRTHTRALAHTHTRKRKLRWMDGLSSLVPAWCVYYYCYCYDFGSFS